MSRETPKVPVKFYRSQSGSEPVREWLYSLERRERHAIGQDLQRVQFRWPIGMPLVRALREGLWEVRSPLPSDRIARVILCFHDDTMVILHGFIKKTQRTTDGDLLLARQRMKEIVK